MYTKKLYIFSLLLLIPFLRITSQPGNLSFNIEAIGGYVSPDIVPFWLRSNQYGSVPLDNASLSMISSARKDYNPNKTNIFDWGASIEGRLNMGHKTTFTLVEGYGKIRISIFEIRAGRTKEVMGMCDTSLSSGSWSISGNAPGIPKVQLSIPEFYVLPWFDELFAIKGQFAHGWLGTVKTAIYRDTSFYRTYLHQKSFYGRVGKPWWNIKLLLGINHQAFYGNPQSYYGSEYTLSPLRSYYYLITGKLYSDENIELYVGNHLGSVDMGFEYAFKRIRLWLYRQNFYDSGALFKLANIQDGLNGISLENKHISNHAFRWKKILFELLYTRNQAGEPWSPPTHDPYEPYYNHGEYIHGWSYNDVGLGTPFITPKAMARKELPSNPDEYFINNRVKVFHLGFEGSVQQMNCMLKLSWSNNFGTYYTSDEEQTTDIEDPGKYGIFGRKEQFSAYLECRRELAKGLNIGCIAAADIGELLYDSFGLLFSVSKSF